MLFWVLKHKINLFSYINNYNDKNLFIHTHIKHAHRKLLSSLFILSDIYHWRSLSLVIHSANLSQKKFILFMKTIDKAHHQAHKTQQLQINFWTIIGYTSACNLFLNILVKLKLWFWMRKIILSAHFWNDYW